MVVPLEWFSAPRASVLQSRPMSGAYHQSGDSHFVSGYSAVSGDWYKRLTGTVRMDHRAANGGWTHGREMMGVAED